MVTIHQVPRQHTSLVVTGVHHFSHGHTHALTCKHMPTCKHMHTHAHTCTHKTCTLAHVFTWAHTYVFTCTHTHTHTCTLTHGHTSKIHGWHPLPSCILMLHEPPPMYAITVAPSPLAHLTHGHTGCRGRGRGRVMRVGLRVRVGEYEYMSTFCGLACCCLHS